eukprot:TRINITY_DN1708_c0_g1_i1.p1 TRINITY_DN1708_c0_g1~~TRINITY_DN1708_c0_g1_i1.p1  ORF type:complete len:325 (+),score=59.60 TRINITY_DN1708_c0_g1_i1:882-1856(+)
MNVELKFEDIQFHAHNDYISSVRFSPDGQCIASTSNDRTCKVHNATGELLLSLEGHFGAVNDCAWHPRENYLCTCSNDCHSKLWSLEKNECIQTLRGHNSFVSSLSFHPLGSILVTGAFDETVRLWDLRCGSCFGVFTAHSNAITDIEFSPDGTMFLTASSEGRIRLWDTRNMICLKTIMEDDSAACSCAKFSPNGRYVLSSTLDSTMRLWDTHGNVAENQANTINPQLMKTYQHENLESKNHLNEVAWGYCQGQRYVVGCSEKNNISMFHLKEMNFINQLELPALPISIDEYRDVEFSRYVIGLARKKDFNICLARIVETPTS